MNESLGLGDSISASIDCPQFWQKNIKDWKNNRNDSHQATPGKKRQSINKSPRRTPFG
jgi:hypothetical protein